MHNADESRTNSQLLYLCFSFSLLLPLYLLEEKYTNAAHKIRVFQCRPRECYLADTAEDQCLKFRLFLSFFHSFVPFCPGSSRRAGVLLPIDFSLFLRLFSIFCSCSFHPSTILLVPVFRLGFFLVFLRSSFLSPSRRQDGVTQMAEWTWLKFNMRTVTGGNGGGDGTFKFTNSVELVARQLDWF